MDVTFHFHDYKGVLWILTPKTGSIWVGEMRKSCTAALILSKDISSFNILWQILELFAVLDLNGSLFLHLFFFYYVKLIMFCPPPFYSVFTIKRGGASAMLIRSYFLTAAITFFAQTLIELWSKSLQPPSWQFYTDQLTVWKVLIHFYSDLYELIQVGFFIAFGEEELKPPIAAYTAGRFRYF